MEFTAFSSHALLYQAQPVYPQEKIMPVDFHAGTSHQTVYSCVVLTSQDSYGSTFV